MHLSQGTKLLHLASVPEVAPLCNHSSTKYELSYPAWAAAAVSCELLLGEYPASRPQAIEQLLGSTRLLLEAPPLQNPQAPSRSLQRIILADTVAATSALRLTTLRQGR